jgi:hypothetical protein
MVRLQQMTSWYGDKVRPLFFKKKVGEPQE